MKKEKKEKFLSTQNKTKPFLLLLRKNKPGKKGQLLKIWIKSKERDLSA